MQLLDNQGDLVVDFFRKDSIILSMEHKESSMARFVIRHKVTGKFLKGTGKYSEWVSAPSEADLYRKKPTSFWWKDVMELVPVSVSLEG